MRVLVAGATSVPGLPLLRELTARGHEVIGLTRSSSKTAPDRGGGRQAGGGRRVRCRRHRQGGRRRRARGRWCPCSRRCRSGDRSGQRTSSRPGSSGAQALRTWWPPRNDAGVRRIVAESVIFAYGYPTTGPAVMDETDPYPGPPPKGGDEMLAALRGMERNVLSSGEHSDTEGIVLRYGCFYGPGVPHDELFVRLAKWWMLPAMTGSGIVSVDPHRRCRQGDGRCPRPRSWRADVQHRRRPAAVVR